MCSDPAAPGAAGEQREEMGRRCGNCATPQRGLYCHGCGQRFLDERLTMVTLARQLGEQLRLERGLLRTLVDMTADPGGAMRAYAAGVRRRYVNPVTYLFFGAALSLFVLQFYGDRVQAWMQQQWTDVEGQQVTGLTASQAEAYNQLLLSLVHQVALSGLLTCILFALFMRLLFWRRMTLPEATVFSLYTFGQALIVHAILALPLYMGLGTAWTMMWSSVLIHLAILIYAGARYFARPLVPTIKVVVAFALSSGAFFIATGIVLLRYVMMTVD